MAHVSKSAASLRISSDSLIPDEVTALLGHAPDWAHAKGEQLVGKRTGAVRIARFGMWSLHSEDVEPENLDAQIADILGRLTPDLAIWRQLSARFKLDLFCGLFLNAGNEGMVLSQTSLLMLGERGIELRLDIYSGECNSSLADE